MNKLRLFLPLLAFLSLALFFIWSLEWRKEESSQIVNRTMEGKPFPQFNLKSIDQQVSYDNNSFPKNKSFLINIWASWCPSCYVEHDYLKELASSGVTIIGINYKDDPIAAQKYLTDLGNPYHFNLADRRGSLAIDLGVTGAPETYLINADGIIEYKHEGVVNSKVWLSKFAPLYQKLK